MKNKEPTGSFSTVELFGLLEFEIFFDLEEIAVSRLVHIDQVADFYLRYLVDKKIILVLVGLHRISRFQNWLLGNLLDLWWRTLDYQDLPKRHICNFYSFFLQ